MNIGTRINNHRFTLIEMLVVISIIAILAALLMPSLGRAIDTANDLACKNNLKQISMSLQMYNDDNSGWFPSIWSWCSTGTAGLSVYTEGNIDIFYMCPENYWAPLYFSEGRNKCLSYGLSCNLGGVYAYPSKPPCHRLSEVESPSRTASLGDGRKAQEGQGNKNSDRFFTRKDKNFGYGLHGERPNFSWVDGHVENMYWMEMYSNPSYDYWSLKK